MTTLQGYGVTSTGSSLPSSDANRHAHTFQAFVEIIFSGDDQAHSMPSYKPGMAMAINPVGGPTKPISIPAAAAHEILRRGVHGRALSALGDYLGVGKAVLADLVGMDRTTASRKVASGQRLPTHATERVLRLLELQSLADDTFEATEAASVWMRRGHEMLEGETPLEWAKSGYGAQRVRELLVALKFGGVV